MSTAFHSHTHSHAHSNRAVNVVAHTRKLMLIYKQSGWFARWNRIINWSTWATVYQRQISDSHFTHIVRAFTRNEYFPQNPTRSASCGIYRNNWNCHAPQSPHRAFHIIRTHTHTHIPRHIRAASASPICQVLNFMCNELLLVLV